MAANASDYLKYLSTAFQIAAELQTASAQFSAGQPVSVPGIKTYLPVGGKSVHVEFDLTVKQLP